MTRRDVDVDPGDLLGFKKEDYFLYFRPATPQSDEDIAGPAGRGGMLLRTAASEEPGSYELFYQVLTFGGEVGWIESWCVRTEDVT